MGFLMSPLRRHPGLANLPVFGPITRVLPRIEGRDCPLGGARSFPSLTRFTGFGVGHPALALNS